MTDTNATDWSFEETFADALDAVPDDQRDPDRIVPGVGPLSADVMLVGEAPTQEVKQGEPFVGQAGSQLDRALEALDRDRGDLYNAIGHRDTGTAGPAITSPDRRRSRGVVSGSVRVVPSNQSVHETMN